MKQGYDISEFQQNVDWSRVKTDFIFIRATSGYRADKKFQDHWMKARLARVPRSAYWYLVGDRPLADQFSLFATMIGGDKGELPPMLDVEDKSLVQRIAPDQLVGFVLAALQALDGWWGKGGMYGDGTATTFLYTYPDFMRSRLHNDAHLSHWPLDWSNLNNNVAPPWPLTIRQYAIEQQPGFPNPIDVNECTDTAWDSIVQKGNLDMLSQQESAALIRLDQSLFTLLDLIEQLQKPSAFHQFDGRMAAMENKLDQLIANTAPAPKP